MPGQMPFYRIKSSCRSSMNFKGAAQTTYVKENYSLSRERIIVIASIASEKQSSTPKG